MPLFIPVSDASDPLVSAYAAVRERDLGGRAQRFVAEGQVVVRTLLSTRSRFELESLLLSEKAARALRPCLQAASPDLPVYVAPQGVMDALAGFHIHRGVLGIGHRATEPAASDLLAGLGRDALVLGLVGIANHDNVGGLFRNAAAFGVGAVLMDASSCDPLYRKAIRVSVGASLVVPFARTARWEELVTLLGAHGFELLALSPNGAETIGEVASEGRIALLVGSEGSGLPAGILERARTIRIPMAPGFDSLNVATAAGIALHRLAGPAAS